MKAKYVNPFTDFGFKNPYQKSAALVNYSPEERYVYEQSLKVFRDNKATYDYAVETAFDDGRNKAAFEIAKNLKNIGVNIEIIINSTGLTKDEIEKL